MFKRGAFLALTLIGGLFINTAVIQQAHAANEISRLVPFQGRLHGTDNKAVADGVYDINFNIYNTPTGGTPAWTESHGQVSVIHGYVNVLLGAINPMHDVNYANVTGTPAYDASKNNVDFTTKKYLGISINGGVEMFPRSQLIPSFHAYTANHADHATQADNADKLGNKAASTYAQLSYVNAADGVLAGRIDSADTTNTSIAGRTAALEGKFTSTKANDANLLDGSDKSEFLLKDGEGKASNANLLDGKDSKDFAAAKNGISFGNNDHGITTADFVAHLITLGAFNSPAWSLKTGWSYAGNQNITDSGYGTIELAGAVIEVFNSGTSAYTIRVTGAPAGPSGHKIYEYINHGDGYTPGWKQITTSRTGTAYDSARLGSALASQYVRNDTGLIPAARLPGATTSTRGATKKNQMSNATNGYFWDKETGFIMMWGYKNANIDGNVWVPFPVSVNNIHNVTTTYNQSASWKGYHGVYVTGVSTSGFNGNRNDDTSGSVANFYWQAIGYKAP